MMKKGKVVLAQPAALAPRMISPRPPLSRAPAPVRGDWEEASFRADLNKYRRLLPDYQQLLEETKAKKKTLHSMKLMKQRLSAEVKFLRKRYKSMSENPSQTIVCRVRNPSRPPPPIAWSDDVVEHRSVAAAAVGGSSGKSLLPVQQRRQLRPPRAASPVVIDLNEACEPIQSHEEVETGDYHGGYPTLLGINSTAKRYLMEEGNVAAAGPSSATMPVFWEVGNPAVRAGKRKISYQDQLVLGV